MNREQRAHYLKGMSDGLMAVHDIILTGLQTASKGCLALKEAGEEVTDAHVGLIRGGEASREVVDDLIGKIATLDVEQEATRHDIFTAMGLELRTGGE